jgi:hypothetical protein
MSVEQTPLSLHRAGPNYVGTITVSMGDEHKLDTDTQPPIILIMDRSGSMGRYTGILTSQVFPLMLTNLGYTNKKSKVIFITFDSEVEAFYVTAKSIQKLPAKARGSTYMAKIFNLLEQFLLEGPRHDRLLDPNPGDFIRILTVSDGELTDQADTLNKASQFASKVKPLYEISSKAVRLFTSQSQPDTRGLASMLQLNTSNPGFLLDIRAETNPEAIADAFTKLFDGEFAGGKISKLKATNAVFMRVPWANPSKEIILKNGKNTFWLKSPPEEVKLDGVEAEVKFEKDLSSASIGVILEDKITYFVDQLKLLKVVNSADAQVEIARIVSYFQDLETWMGSPDEPGLPVEGCSLKQRAQFMKHTILRKLKSISMRMENIANDSKVASLNLAQQAEYLRQVDVSKNARGLAKRAVASGVDFDDKIRSEVIMMRDHEDELDGIDLKDDDVSFYSQDSTLESIRQLCELARDPDVFDNMGAIDILQLFSLVGVPCVSPIGDYPDPMTYRIERLLLGSLVSVADLSIAQLSGGKLKDPVHRIEIDNVIPIFGDQRIQKFIQKYAHTSLECICSIGMRRMLAEVPKTFPYTLCAGIWKLVEDIDKSKSDVNISLFRKMVYSYDTAIGDYYNYLFPLFETNQDPEKSYFLNHNGITNMIDPLFELVKTGKTKYIPRILRALYSYESYQAMRRVCKHQDPSFRVALLDKLLGVDFHRRGSPMPPKFERNEPKHCSDYFVDSAEFNRLKKEMWYIQYCTLLPELFEAILSSDPTAEMKKIPKLTEERAANYLRLDFGYDEFILYNIVEGLLYGDKQSRIDKETNKPLLPDLGNRAKGDEMIRKYVVDRYQKDYEARLKDFAGQEQKELCQELVNELQQSKSVESFCRTLQHGITKGMCHLSITNMASVGFTLFHDVILDKTQDVTLRAEKLIVWYTGRDPKGEPVWNGGNVLRCPRAPLKDLLMEIGAWEEWTLLEDRLMNRSVHVYRVTQLPNRHGHWDDLQSYWALGFDTLQQYFESTDDGEREAYTQRHAACCGVSAYLSEHHAANIM